MKLNPRGVIFGIVWVVAIGVIVWGWYYPGKLRYTMPLFPNAYCGRFVYLGTFDITTQVYKGCPFGCVEPKKALDNRRNERGVSVFGMPAPPPKICEGW